ncbi:MAG: acyl-CoA dehydrogenase family protein, partial [Betaproteobacteria bacterium]|nr:acyl-CoA dehydrogenase family protein [Betaproteobacteria bacterium]
MAWAYEAPLRDMRFVLEHVLDAPASWAACPAHSELDLDTACAVLEQGARFASERLQPLNRPGDLEGCRLDGDGGVRTPQGFRAAYQAFVEAGWPALAADPRWGGQGLPLLLDGLLREMLDACNHAWNMYPDLLHGAVQTLAAHGSDELRQRYLPRLVSGEWLAAMALTEPQAGSDLGLVRTRAEPQADGSLRVSGGKIFISGGEHDLSDNIVHLVLCRLPGSAPGTRGLSLALVPRRLPDGSRNAMRCEGLEHKMGIKASATCVMHYDEAVGWLVGEPGRGLAAMFVMMNSARLHVALQGLGHAEMAAQNAL